jgi:predicted RNA-binding protein with TRAM domain
MPRRLPERTKNAPRQTRGFGSQIRFRPSIPFLQLRPAKENQEVKVVIDDVESRGNGVAWTQGYLIFVLRSKMGERVMARIRSLSGRFALAEGIA